MLAVDGWLPERSKDPKPDPYQGAERILRRLTLSAALMLLSAAAAASVL